MSKLEIPLKLRFRMTVLCIASTGSFLVFSLYQALNGRSRLDLDLAGGLMFLSAALLLLPVAAVILYRSTQQFISSPLHTSKRDLVT